MAWSSVMAPCLPSASPGVPGGSCRAIHQSRSEGQQAEETVSGQMHFVQRLCIAGKVCFSHSLCMNIHVFHKCLILSEQSCNVSFVGGLGTGRQ